MLIAWRLAKRRRPVYDGTGALLVGGRWHSAGRPIIHASDSFAGALLEILAHAARPRTLPGPHDAVRIEIPDALIESLAPEELPGWELRESGEARAFGDRWLAESRSAVLVVPSVPARPVGRTVLINPLHADAAAIAVSDPFPVPWGERLF